MYVYIRGISNQLMRENKMRLNQLKPKVKKKMTAIETLREKINSGIDFVEAQNDTYTEFNLASEEGAAVFRCYTLEEADAERLAYHLKEDGFYRFDINTRTITDSYYDYSCTISRANITKYGSDVQSLYKILAAQVKEYIQRPTKR